MSPRLSTFNAFVRREFRTGFRNRFIHGFAALALLCGLGIALLAPSAGSMPFMQLQVALYLAPLFGTLIGVSSAHGELEERELLLSQPISRFAWAAGKAAALVIAAVSLFGLVFVPAAFAGAGTVSMLALWALGAELAAVFILLGLAVGFSTPERARGLMYAALLWLFLVIGFDALAFAAAQMPFFRAAPVLWLSLLLLNPVDSARVAALFRLEDIPFQAPAESPVVSFWLEHLMVWNLFLAVVWIAGLLAWTRFRLESAGAREN